MTRMRHEYPLCKLCGQRHGNIEGCEPDVGNLPRNVLWFFIGLMAMFLLIFSVATCQGAVTVTEIGVTLPRDGTTLFQLHPLSAGPEFAIVCNDAEVVIERNWPANKNGKVVGFHSGDWDGTAACLHPGDVVAWDNYAGHNHLRWDWKPGVTGYLGLLANPDDTGADYFSGWLHVRWNPDASLTLLDYGIESEANIPLTIIPEPAISFILFALAALLLLRRTRTDHHHENHP